MNSFKWRSVSCDDIADFFQVKVTGMTKRLLHVRVRDLAFVHYRIQSDLARFVRVLTCSTSRHIVQPFETLTRDLPSFLPRDSANLRTANTATTALKKIMTEEPFASRFP